MWLWLAGEAQRRIDAAAADLRDAGWRAAWQSRHVGGYPFRLDVDFAGLVLADPSGWGVSAPVLKTEAYAYLPTRWVMFAPAGLTLTRPGGGAVSVAGRAIRASVNSWDEHPPRISFEGDDLTFAAAPGARPFPLTGATSVEIYTRAGPDDQGAVLLRVEGGRAAPAGWIDSIAQARPVDLTFEAFFAHAGALQGRDWRSLLAAWTRAGGALQVRQASVVAGSAGVDARGGVLTIAADGSLAGTLPAKVSQPGQAAAQALPLSFRDGATWLGATRLGPAPHAY